MVRFNSGEAELEPAHAKVAGRVTGNGHLEHEGEFQYASGVVRMDFYDLKQDIKKASQSESLYSNLSVRLLEVMRAQ